MPHPRTFPIYRPRSGECPKALLGCIPANEFDLDNIRIMKDENQVIGAYRFACQSSEVYLIHSIKVVIDRRGEKLGSWLLAHVLGIIESQGGLMAKLAFSRQEQFFMHRGFVRDSKGDLVFRITRD